LPTYEYQCSKCEHITEVELPITGPHPQTIPCQKCASCAKRIISLSTFVLKGSGWDRDGYDKKAQKKESPNITPT
jgi:putative FmdB family regulatory protein